VAGPPTPHIGLISEYASYDYKNTSQAVNAMAAVYFFRLGLVSGTHLPQRDAVGL